MNCCPLQKCVFLLSFPQESDYFTPQGEFRVDKAGSPTLLNCLMYKMSYYRFGEMQVIVFFCHYNPYLKQMCCLIFVVCVLDSLTC